MVDSMWAGTQQSSYYDIILEWYEPIEFETGLEYWDDHYALNLIGHLERLGIRKSVRLYLVTHCETVKDMRDRVQYLRDCRYDGGKKSMLDELEAVVWTTKRLDLSIHEACRSHRWVIGDRRRGQGVVQSHCIHGQVPKSPGSFVEEAARKFS